LCQQTNELITI
jgi:hypothetical protein